jgi:hypothetical protein
VDGQGNVTPRPVELGPRLGDLRVIRRGIGPNDRIIINGLQRVMPGQKVQPNMAQITPNGQAEPRATPTQPVPSSIATPASGQ